ncbi:MAG: 3-hydroxyacyl-ACP dehydratase [Bacteroidota bacterium]
MLKDDFFYIQSLSDEQGIISAVIEINPYHKIFEGHFPGQPVVPGVCMMQMIKEITEAVTHRDFFLQKADVVKFLSVIVPEKDKMISARIKYSEIENHALNFEASLYKDEVIYLKFKGEFVAEYQIAS